MTNQQNTAVSVVRVGASTQGDDSSQDSNGTCDSQNDGNPHVNLTVEGFYPPSTAQANSSEGPSETLVDSFLEMDPEQLERLETALQSEQAKQILGENVTAMLGKDMLSVEEETAQLTDSIRMDHCYTNLSPSSAPTTSATPNHQYGPVGSSDTDASDNSFDQEHVRQPIVTSSTPTQQPARTRGRGRGPGRPRKDISAVRSSQSYRGSSRGTGRGIIRTTRGGQLGTVAPGMVMVQQIKPINPPLAPPPSSPSSASLVPLIKPLVITDRRQQITSALTGTTGGQVTVQKQVVAVPVSGESAHLVTLTGAKLGQIMAGGQQRLLIASNRTLQQQQLQKQKRPQLQKQKQQILTSTGPETGVTTTKNEGSQLPAQQDHVSSSVIPGMTVAPGQAKVLVAKMPTIPPQLLGAEPSTGLSEALQEDKLPDNEADFTHFPGQDEENEDLDASEEESDEELDADDEEYVGPGGGSGRRRGRFGAKYRGGNRRMPRGARTRGSGRSWDRGGARGLGKVGAKRRGGRGRGGLGRPEDIERAQRLEAEMAAALAAMDQSPDRESLIKSVGSERVRLDRIDASRIVGKQEGQVENSDLEIGTIKKVVKVYGKGNLKKKLNLSKDAEGKVDEVTETKKTPEKPVTPPSPEKKVPVKSPVRKHSTDVLQPPSATPPSTPTGTEASKIDGRKNYPKRENRKPPAHLAEALGPALFSTPDIIRRVSTGSEQKATASTPEMPPAETKKDARSPSAPNDGVSRVNLPESTETPSVQEEADSVKVSGSTEPEAAFTEDMGTDLQVPEDQSLLDTLHVEATKTEEELLADALLLQQHIGDDASATETESVDVAKPVNSDSSPEEPMSGTDVEESSSEVTSAPPVTTVATKLPASTSVAVTRSTRRRSSNVQEVQPKKDVARTVSQKQQQSRVRERRKSDESKGVQVKGRARSRISETKDAEDDEEDDSEAESSDESWNSEDDPDRLWCICKKPHNNRFMICCDSCEDWFHGKCVGVTKSMGKQMEENGLEWCCPNCNKKKETDGKEQEHDARKQSRTVKEKDIKKSAPKETLHKSGHKESQKELQNDPKEPVNAEEVATSPVQRQQTSVNDGVMYCIVCKKEARPTSIYCSDSCILKHAQESLSLINKEKHVAVGTQATAAQMAHNQTQVSAPRGQNEQQLQQHLGMVPGTGSSSAAAQLPRARPDARVIVFERKTGRLLAGPNAPTAGNLKTWLKDNPTFEVVRPGVMPTTKFYNQKTVGQLKQVQNTKSLLTQSKVVTAQPKSIAFQPKPVAGAVVTTKSQLVSPVGRVHKPVTSTPSVPIAREVSTKNVAKVGQGVKSPTGTSKAINKSAGTVTPVAQGGKPLQVPAVSKVPATSTVKENTVTKSQPPVVTKKIEVKRTSSTSPIEVPKKEEEKPPGPEPIRINVRKTLQELLQSRIQECTDLIVAEEDVQKIALNVEEEMHTYFRDTGIKYKSKYRSLVFNIKDPKNLTLFRKIVDKSVTPFQLVRLSPEELASQELAQWREREAKHQLEMIKKNELDLMALSKTYVMKTHKGEQVIETDESMKMDVPELVDPSAVPDLVSALNNSVSSTVEDTSLEENTEKMKDKGREGKDKEKRKDKSRSSRDRERSRRDDKKRGSRDREHSKDKDGSRHESHRDNSRSERDGRRSGERKSSSKSKHHHHHHGSSERDRDRNRKERRDDELKKDEVQIKKEDLKKSIKEESKVMVDNRIDEEDTKNEVKTENESQTKLESLTEVKVEEDSDLSDREPSSTVTIKTPDINNIDDSSTLGTLDTDKSSGASASVWKGFVNMPDVAKFFTTVQVVSGDSQNLCKDLPDTVDIVGRIVPETVWDYISKMKKSGTKEILVIRLTAANDEEKIPYITLYTYLNTRNRLGVVGNVSKMIKDFYIMPLASHNPVPQVLLPLDGPGFEDYRPHLLLGILVRARRKRLAPELTYVAKVPKRPPPLPSVLETTERSYTPPLPGSGDDIGSLTPPHPPPKLVTSEGFTPPHSPKHTSFGAKKFCSNTDPRLMRKPNQDIGHDGNVSEKQTEELVPSVTVPPATSKFTLSSMDGDEDDDAPYSPGGGVDEDTGESGEDNLLATPKNPSELQRKMEELNRKIEEQKQQIQSISSAIVGTESAGASTVGVTGVEPLQVRSVMQSYMIEPGDEACDPAPAAVSNAEDENEAYSPSRSFTPPPSDSIPFIGAPSDSTASVLSAIPSNISLPSNLSEILASIKKRESDNSSLTTGIGKGINLKEDPIVQNYTSGRSSNVLEATKAEIDDLNYVPQEHEISPPTQESYSPSSVSAVTQFTSSTTATTASLLSPASSAVPALLSLSMPVVHPPSTKTEVNLARDPRQKQTDLTKAATTLSSLSDDDLIKKAMEMELATAAAEKQSTVTNPTLQQPLPPGVDSFPVPPSSAALPPLPAAMKPSPTPVKSLPSGQPLPPGLEDEEYPSYSSSYAPAPPPSQTVAPPHAIQSLVPHQIPPPPINYSVRHPSPGPYHMPPHHYNAPPPSAYNLGPPHVAAPQGGSFSSSYVSAPQVLYGGGTTTKASSKTIEDTGSMLRNKRKFQDVEDDIPDSEKRESSSSGHGRESWDKKVPIPMRGRFNPRGGIRSGGGRFGSRGGGHHLPRGYLRPRGGRNGPSHRTRWGPLTSDDMKLARYDVNIHSEWDSHIKEFEEKQRERTRELKQRERERNRDRSASSSSRSYSCGSRSGKNRNSDKGGDDSS
ncbi:death-inducer obliterator 1 isoform X4 [Cryptotermes secundus]|uniref:death-inducer obliterator 1 isoform X4 n=1 Tax=Cryptotermes secundus TaxID=105785 RepID=UPI000CD7C88E|nr:death-inducer obliterator 1 isoform X4 [Cryptotermes secundus]